MFQYQALPSTASNKDHFIVILVSQCDQIWEISPLWPMEHNLRQTLYGLFSVWQHFEPTQAKLYVVIGPIFISVHGNILKNNLPIWSHCSQSLLPKELELGSNEFSLTSYHASKKNILTKHLVFRFVLFARSDHHHSRLHCEPFNAAFKGHYLQFAFRKRTSHSLTPYLPF